MLLVYRHYKSGFTLIELLVVVAIIGILASVVLVSLSGTRHRAEATALVEQLQYVETAFFAMSLEGDQQWPHMYSNTYNHQANYINWMIDNPTHSHNVFPKLAKNIGNIDVNSMFTYYNRGTPYTCTVGPVPDSSVYTVIGVVLRIEEIDPAVFKEMDRILDKNDGPYCGKVRLLGSSGSMYYLLGENSNDR